MLPHWQGQKDDSGQRCQKPRPLPQPRTRDPNKVCCGESGGGSDLSGEIPILEAQELRLEPASHSGIFTALGGQPGAPEVHAEPTIHVHSIEAAGLRAPNLWHRGGGHGRGSEEVPCLSCCRIPFPLPCLAWLHTWVPMDILCDVSKGLMKGVL